MWPQCVKYLVFFASEFLPYSLFVQLSTVIIVRMASEQDNENSIKISPAQMEEIKAAVLNSVLEVLPRIVNAITPKIIESAEEFEKKNLNEIANTTTGIPVPNTSSIKHAALKKPTSVF